MPSFDEGVAVSMPQYSSYRQSGVEWLGPIPSHWEMGRLKRRCDVFPSNVDKKSIEGELPVHLCNYTDVYYNDRITPDMSFMEATASEDQISKFTLRAGDTIFTKDSETADDIGIASHVPEDMPGVVCGYHLSVARPRGRTHGAYVKRLFDAYYTKACFEVLANGLTRVGLNQHAVDNIELPWPPFEEQVSIASFLDRETAKIDALIAEQEKLLALLAEKRQATISHAVTRGLNPNAPMKDSGIPWLGEVPAHWKVVRLKHVVPQITVGIVVEPSKYYVDEGVPALRSLNVKDGAVSPESLVFISAESNDLLAKSKIFAGDIVVVRSGQTGAAAVVPEAFDGANCIDLIIIRKPQVGCERFLCWFLASHAAFCQFEGGSEGAIQKHFNIGTAANVIISWPSPEEQRDVVAFLDAELAKLAELEAMASREVGLLRERRGALISAAVTGKIDVRGTVSRESKSEVAA